MKVRITTTARGDLLRIAENLSMRGASDVPAFLRRIREKALKLGEMPLAYPVVARVGVYEIHRRPYGDYLIFYVVKADVVRVIHVVHGARDVDPVDLPGFRPPTPEI